MLSFLTTLVRRSIALVAFFALFAQPVLAQNQGDGSIYSRFGVGELRNFSSAQALGLGGGGYAIRSINYINLDNPATWGEQVFTRFNAGFRHQGLEARNGDQGVSRLSGGSVSAAAFSFPILTGELGFAVSYQPYSRSNYRVVLEREMHPDPAFPDSTIDYQVNLEGSGGLQEIRSGLGYRFNDNISVGASVNAIFGIIEGNRRVEFLAPGFTESLRTDGTNLRGVTGTVGTHISLTDLLAEDDLFSLGASVTLPATLSGSQSVTIGRDLDRDTLRTESGSVSIPWNSTVGLAYQPDNRWTIVADGSFSPWSTASNTFDIGRSLPGDFPAHDRFRLSGGAEHLPASQDATEPYLRRVAYRLGAFFEQTYTPIPPQADTGADTPRTAINTFGVTGGVSLPTLLPGTRIDVNLEAGIRGTTSQDLVQDRFYGVSLTVNAGERWFQRRRLR